MLCQEDSPKIVVKCLIALAFGLTAFSSILMALTPPATGYEISIYAAFPLFAWIAIVISIAIGISLLVLSPIHKCRFAVKYALPIVILNYTIVLCLPLIRGYFISFDPNYDTLYHIAEARSIYESGHINPRNWYPVIHVLLASINMFDVPFEIGIVALTAFFSCILISFYFMLARCLQGPTYEGLLISASAIPLLFFIYHRILMPSYCSLFLVPLVLYMIHRVRVISNYIPYAILGILTCVLIVFFHPLTAIITLSLIFAFFVSDKFPCFNADSGSRGNRILYVFLIISVVFFLWQLRNVNFAIFFGKNVPLTIDYFLNSQFGNNIVSDQMQILNADPNSESVPILLVIEGIIKIYGILIAYVAIGVAVSASILKDIWRRKSTYFHSTSALQYACGLALMALLLTGLATGEIHRAAQYVLILSPILVGIGLYMFTQFWRIDLKSMSYVIVIIFICFVAILGIFSIYQSPWHYGYNQMTTFSEKSGLNWYISNYEESIVLVSPFLETRSWAAYYYGDMWSDKRIKQYDYKIPTDFGYDKNRPSIYLPDLKTYYLFTNEKMRQYHLGASDYRKPLIPQYTEYGFQRLGGDNSIEKIYSTGDFVTWLVK